MPESFGARLRQQRERQHVEIAAIAERTKIKQSLLEELERDNVSHWPGGIFRRAYIRSYAHAIGLDPEEVVREFVREYPDPSDLQTEAPPAVPGAADRDAPSRPPMRLRYVMETAMGAIGRRPAPADRPGPSGDPPSPPLPADAGPDLEAAASLCAAFARVAVVDEMTPLLRGVARLLGATGLIIWVWDADGDRLRPVLAHGYPDRVLAQVPALERDADNATAEAFRSGRPCAVESRNPSSGALVIPLMTPSGCSGVLAIELPAGRQQIGWIQPLATIFAAQLARLTEPESLGDAASRLPA
jgi:transcriptional regulator with XRE-family HTH domain